MERRKFLTSAAALGVGALSMESCQNSIDKDSSFNVRDYGAKGDGATSDTKAIQAALDAAGKVCGTVWFPSGIYLCHDLRVPSSVHLKGDPAWLYKREEKGAVLKLDDENARCILNVTDAFGVHVYGLVLNGISKTPQPVHGILQDNATGTLEYSENGWSKKEDTFVFDDIKVMNCSGHGIYLRNIWLFIIRHSHFMGNVGDGVCIRGWDGFVTDNQFSGNGGNGFACEEVGATVMFTCNRVEWNGGYGLFITNGDDWNVTGNSFDRNHGAGLCVENVQALAITGNVFRRCGKDSAQLSEGERSCQVRLKDCRGMSFVGNTCLAGQDDGGKGLFTPQVGFIVQNMSYSVISGNTLFNGYMDEMLVDLGGHGPEYIFKDNVGCPKKN